MRSQSVKVSEDVGLVLSVCCCMLIYYFIAKCILQLTCFLKFWVSLLKLFCINVMLVTG